MDTVLISLTKGKYAIIDAIDAQRVMAHKWCAVPAGQNWYARRSIYLKKYKYGAILLHRFIMDAPQGLDVDHINGDGLDCRRSNMRLATRQQNCCNQRLKAANKSGYRGVSYANDTKGRAWRAQIVANCKIHSLGRFANAEEAGRAYDAAAKRLHGEFARLNFPE